MKRLEILRKGLGGYVPKYPKIRSGKGKDECKLHMRKLEFKIEGEFLENQKHLLPDPAPVPWWTITAARSYRLLPAKLYSRSGEMSKIRENQAFF